MRNTMSNFRARLVFAAFLSALLAPATRATAPPNAQQKSQSTILYVDDDAPPGGDGLSWETAFKYLRDALAVANAPGSSITEVRVAQGTHKPDQGAGQTPGDRQATFLVPGGLALRGGYAGITHDDPDARDWNVYPSILSGDLLGNDGPPGSYENYNDNTLHVVTTAGSELITVEGITITAGNAVMPFMELQGGGLVAINANVVIDHCRITLCRATMRGGAQFTDSTVIIRDSQFIQNIAQWHWGGLGLVGGSLVLQKCLFQQNRSGTSGGGAGIGMIPAESSTIEDCDFIGNWAGGIGNGGAIVKFGSASVSVIRSRFVNNFADNAAALSGNFTAENCLFHGNSAGNTAGAVAASSTFIRCDFLNNSASYDSGAGDVFSGTFVECRFEKNLAYSNTAGAIRGGGMFVNCELKHNDCWIGGGGAVRVLSPTTFINCGLTENVSKDPGGAVRINPGLNASFINTTVANNDVATNTGGISCGGSATIINSVVWGNTNGDLTGNADVMYSCIGGGWPGEGNIATDPLFVDASGSDYRLLPDSPCIDAGDNTELPGDTFDLNQNDNTTELLPVDLDGGLRRVNIRRVPNTGFPPGPIHAPMVDMGCYELPAPRLFGDINGDGWVSATDLLLVIDSWGPCADPANCPADIAPQDGDGIVNVHDLVILILNWG